MDHFKGKQFMKDVIIVAVGYYLQYNLSLSGDRCRWSHFGYMVA